jgi:heat shock protein HtpX
VDRDSIVRHRARNALHTLLLLGAMLGLVGLLAYAFLGGLAVPWILIAVGSALLLAPRLSPEWLLRLSGATPLQPSRAPELYRALQLLARRAGLERLPTLYYVPRRVPNAFSVGGPDHAAIGLTAGILRQMSFEELVGILAHELAHVRHNDLRVMQLADSLARLTGSFSFVGALLLLVNLPMMAAGGAPFPWLGVLGLVFSPTLTALLQLGLARTREYAADLEGARLTGNPRALASALRKLERAQSGFLELLFLRPRHGPAPTWLRTHPATDERIRRLLELKQRPEDRPSLGDAQRLGLPRDLAIPTRRFGPWRGV